MAFKIKNGSYGFPQSGEHVAVYYTGTDQLVSGLTTPDSNAEPLDNPFVISEEQDWWGFELPSVVRVDVWWHEQRRYIAQNVMCCDVTLLDNPFPQYMKIGEETDPVFTAWDKSTGIIITKDQISDLDNYQGNYQGVLVSGDNIKTINGESILGSGDLKITLNETDPIFTAWNKRDGILVSKNQILDLKDYQEELVSGGNIKTVNGESILGSGELTLELSETDPVFTAWDRTSGISITESQISDFGNYQEQLVSATNIKLINTKSLLGSGNLVVDGSDYEENDPIFTAWNKSDGISITESQISDLGNYQEELVSGTNIKTINGESVLGGGNLAVPTSIETEEDPVFTAWNRCDGIEITESQINDLGDYQEQLVSGTDIKTVNGESMLGSGNLVVPTDVVGNEEVVNVITNTIGNDSWLNGATGSSVDSVGDVIQTFATVDSTWLPCNHSEHLVEDYPRLAPMMVVASYETDDVTPISFYTPTIQEPNGIEDGAQIRNTYYVKAK